VGAQKKKNKTLSSGSHLALEKESFSSDVKRSASSKGPLSGSLEERECWKGPGGQSVYEWVWSAGRGRRRHGEGNQVRSAPSFPEPRARTAGREEQRVGVNRRNSITIGKDSTHPRRVLRGVVVRRKSPSESHKEGCRPREEKRIRTVPRETLRKNRTGNTSREGRERNSLRKKSPLSHRKRRVSGDRFSKEIPSPKPLAWAKKRRPPVGKRERTLG